MKKLYGLIKNSVGVISIGVLVFSPIMVNATENDLPSGREIIERVNARDEGESVARDLLMVMTDKRGKKRERDTKSFRKYFGDEKRTVIFYQSPKNIKGTAFLTYDYPDADRDDDQWLYLPASRKVRRISASDRGDYFLGTDFTYEDIKLESKIGINDYIQKTVGEETIDGHHCYVVESIPVNEETAKELGYGRVLARIDSEIWIVRKAEFWDRKDNPLKTIQNKNISQVQGIWTTHIIDVQNHKTGHHTSFTFSNINYQAKVADSVFTERALRRGL